MLRFIQIILLLVAALTMMVYVWRLLWKSPTDKSQSNQTVQQDNQVEGSQAGRDLNRK